MEGLARVLARTYIVDIPLLLFDSNKAVSGVEAIGLTLSQCTNPDWKLLGVCFRKHLLEHRCANASTLTGWMNIEVIKHEFTAMGPDDKKADTGSFQDDVPRVLWGECRHESLTGTHGIKPADARKTISHGFDSKRDEVFRICYVGGNESDGRLRGRHYVRPR